MSLFEFLMVLVSIIIGLGIAEILTGIARVIRCRETIQGYWVHFILVIIIFTALLQQWWEIWGVRVAPEWTFPGLIMMLGGPVGLFLMAHLVFPEPVQGVSLREYYYGAMRPIWWLGALTVAMATLFRPLVLNQDLLATGNATSFVLFFGLIFLATSKNRILHAVFVPVFLLLILLDVLLVSFSIGQS